MFRKPKSPETIPTEFGWANPKTGELLVSIKGLPNPVKNFIPGRPYNQEIIPQPVEEVVGNNEILEDKPNTTRNRRRK